MIIDFNSFFLFPFCFRSSGSARCSRAERLVSKKGGRLTPPLQKKKKHPLLSQKTPSAPSIPISSGLNEMANRTPLSLLLLTLAISISHLPTLIPVTSAQDNSNKASTASAASSSQSAVTSQLSSSSPSAPASATSSIVRGKTGGVDDCEPDMIGFELVTGYVFTAPDDLLDSIPGTLMLTDCLEACQNNDTCHSVNYETGLCVMFSSNADKYPGKQQSAGGLIFFNGIITRRAPSQFNLTCVLERSPP